MQIHLISIGNRMPAWVDQGCFEYSKRLPKECQLRIKDIPPGIRNKNSNIDRTVIAEGERLLHAVPAGGHIVALDGQGKHWSTEDVAIALKRWLESGRHVALMLGGPDGLSDSVKQSAQEIWSLSRLTFPHPLVRIIVAEQIYRAWTILNNHPYHRA